MLLRHVALAAGALLLSAPPLVAADETGVHAITGARLVLAPGQVVESGTLVIRDGRIVAAGADARVPADARLWGGAGLTVYPGLIDIYLAPPKPRDEREPRARPGPPRPEPAPEARGATHPLAAVQAQRRAVELEPPSAERVQALREAGFTVVQLVPGDGVLRGASAVVGLGDGTLGETALRPDAAQVISFEPTRGGYPGSRMGAIALVRQSLLDARWYAEALAAWQRGGAAAQRPTLNLAWQALGPVAAGERPALFVTEDALAALRAGAVARELSLKGAYAIEAGDGYKRAAELAAAGLPLVAPLHFPDPPKLERPGDDALVETAELRHWQRAPGDAAALRAAGIEVAFTGHGLDKPSEARASLARAIAAGLSADDALAALTTVPARLLGLGDRLGRLAPGHIANLTLVKGSLFEPGDAVESVWVDGRRYAPKPKPEAKKNAATDEAAAPAEAKPDTPPQPVAVPEVAGDPEAWRAQRPEQPAALLVRGATIWTSGPASTLEDADLLVRAGRIEAVGPGLQAPPGALVIDAAGRHVTPGLIDAHSHAALTGGVNECTDSVTAEVRMRDALDSESIHVYRLLAGGTTVQHLLHGSCNAIGGQSALIKNRWGAAPEALLFEGAPATIKFALGENPKRAGGSDRYPRSRMGVEQVIRESFTAARDYAADLERARSGGPAVRRDLRLESVAEILAGTRAIHSHAYRQNEILMLMRTAEDFGTRVGCFQHILEGYKVADEMAAHGACGSGFSDWWAYKWEVYDAIPYNGFLMWDRGVSVSFNSDSAELARHLNTEAAKAVKYGGVPPDEALRFVTLNPARQLGIDARVGSLEPGKDADFVIWSGSPLSTLSRVDETWVDGRRYFDRAADLAGRAALEQERTALLDAARAAGEKKKPSGDGSGAGRGFAYTHHQDASCSADETASAEELSR